MSLLSKNPKPGKRQHWTIPSHGDVEVLGILTEEDAVVCDVRETGKTAKVEQYKFDQELAVCHVCDGAILYRTLRDEKAGKIFESDELQYLFNNVTPADLLIDDPDVAEVWMNGEWHDITKDPELEPGIWSVGRYYWWKEVPVAEVEEDTSEVWVSEAAISLMRDFGSVAGIVAKELSHNDLYKSIKATLRAARLANLRPVWDNEEAPKGYGFLTEQDAADGVGSDQAETLDRILAIVDGRFEDHPGFGQMLLNVQAVLDAHKKACDNAWDAITAPVKGVNPVEALEVIGVDMGQGESESVEVEIPDRPLQLGEQTVEIPIETPQSREYAGMVDELENDESHASDCPYRLKGECNCKDSMSARDIIETQPMKSDEFDLKVTDLEAGEDWQFPMDDQVAYVKIERFGADTGRLHNATIPDQDHLVLAMVGSRVRANGKSWVINGFTKSPETFDKVRDKTNPWPIPVLGMEWAVLISEEEAKRICQSQ